MKKYLVLSLILLVFGGTSAAYIRITFLSPAGQSPRWPAMPVPYWINESGLSQIPNGSEFVAIQEGFRAWQNVSAADVRFDYRGMTSVQALGLDGLNLVTFADDSTPLGSSTVAATFSFFGREGNTIVITEADIVFNTAFEYSTSGESNKFDIQSVATHEIGHLLGLDHSGLISSVMVPFAARTQIDQRTLAYDDSAGVSEIYPRLVLTATGQIRGTVRQGTAPIFGAHVVAVTADGTPLVSTVTQPDGSYVFRSLPIGRYRIYAEPFDGPVTSQNFGNYFSNINTDFGTTYFGDVGNLSDSTSIDLLAVTASAVADIRVLPRSSNALNLSRPSVAPRIARSTQNTLCIGGENITAGVAVTASSPSIVVGSPTFGSLCSTAPTSVAMPITVSATAPFGPKNVSVNRGGESSVVSGTIVIVDPKPSDIQVAPSTGRVDGGALVTITGNNFRTDAQVAFGGLPAADVLVINSGTILATTPRNSPGPMNVQVINSDGTAGIAQQLFTYTSPAPTIARVFPSSGSPASSVVITGEHFDNRSQNLTVRFNGVSARVISATSTSILTVVPYGAQSGPISVTVFDQTATGPFFTILEPPISTNLASESFRFVDASSSAGGTDLTFSENDDAMVLTDLPFTFSLFRDIYLAGTRLSISTNGWLSLETLSLSRQSSAFQNVHLGTAQAPPSLIAPFWDDLVLSAASRISTRTVGTAPNRQFFVQWTKMSILDENGNDLNASLTFQAVLFEGSNDIQFGYQTLTGARSDGSSATVGIQDLRKLAFKELSFNQAILRNSYFATHHFQSGQYTTITMMPDTTAPSRPIVTDAGEFTPHTTELSVSWTSGDPESGIREFQYAIGRTPGATDVRPYTSVAQNAIVATDLLLQPGSTYFVAVRAINNFGLVSEVGVSDGIQIDPAFQTFFKVIPSVSQNSSDFTGLALLSMQATSVVLKALDLTGTLITGIGIQNPAIVPLSAGQQHARLVTEIFGLQAFDGWIELESSSPGLGVYVATGASDLSQMDGGVARGVSSDFALFHPGGIAVLANPSVRPATVTVSEFGTSAVQTFVVPARSQVTRAISGPMRVRSSEPLASIERFVAAGKLSIGGPEPVSQAQAALVFPHAVTGSGYTSTLSLANVTNGFRDVTISFGGSSRTVRMEAGTAIRVSLAEFLSLSVKEVRLGAVRVSASLSIFGPGVASLIGVVEVENGSSLTTIGARPASMDIIFPHVAHGNGLFTGLAIVTGERGAAISIDVYPADGSTPKSAMRVMGVNQHVGELISELAPSVTSQTGGYIRLRSDEPIWAWELYGSAEMLASGPPL